MILVSEYFVTLSMPEKTQDNMNICYLKIKLDIEMEGRIFLAMTFHSYWIKLSIKVLKEIIAFNSKMTNENIQYHIFIVSLFWWTQNNPPDIKKESLYNISPR